MDDTIRFNQERWEELASAKVIFSRPWLDLDETVARERVDPEEVFGKIRGKDVLCLAGGGGQQSAAFGLLGARVTVFDFSQTQLQRDRETAVYYGIEINTVQGDMRNLSTLPKSSFDIVWHGHSLNFVPDALQVFTEVSRVLRQDGIYRLSCHNPYLHGVCEDNWNGEGYLLHLPYVEGELRYADSAWDVDDGEGGSKRIEGPKEFRHSLSTLINGLLGQGFLLLRVSEETRQNPEAEPGSWEHFSGVTAPYVTFWLRYLSELPT